MAVTRAAKIQLTYNELLIIRDFIKGGNQTANEVRLLVKVSKALAGLSAWASSDADMDAELGSNGVQRNAKATSARPSNPIDAIMTKIMNDEPLSAEEQAAYNASIGL